MQLFCLIGCNHSNAARPRPIYKLTTQHACTRSALVDPYNAEPGDSSHAAHTEGAARVHKDRTGVHSRLAGRGYFFFRMGQCPQWAAVAARALSVSYFRTCPSRIAVAGIEAAPPGGAEENYFQHKMIHSSSGRRGHFYPTVKNDRGLGTLSYTTVHVPEC